jgi:hypothetical protein
VALSVVTKFRRPARSEFFWAVERAERLRLTAELVSLSGRAVVYCRSMPDSIRVASELSRIGVPAASVEHRDFTSSRVRARVVTDETALSCGRESTSCVVQFDPAVSARRYRRRLDMVSLPDAAVVSFIVPEREAETRRLLRALDLPDVLTGPDLPAVHAALVHAADASIEAEAVPADGHDADESLARHALLAARSVVLQLPKGATWAGHAVSRRVRNARRDRADRAGADGSAAGDGRVDDESDD